MKPMTIPIVIDNTTQLPVNTTARMRNVNIKSVAVGAGNKKCQSSPGPNRSLVSLISNVRYLSRHYDVVPKAR